MILTFPELVSWAVIGPWYGKPARNEFGVFGLLKLLSVGIHVPMSNRLWFGFNRISVPREYENFPNSYILKVFRNWFEFS